MDDGQYILPSELAILAVFMFFPAMLVASIGQFWFLRRRGLPLSRIWLFILAMVAASSVVTASVWVLAAASLPRALGLQDLFVGSVWVPVLPLAFVVAAVFASAISFWASHRA